ncbi:MAG: DPP IV N-terminal domain-containing protein, partial [Pyrinomonadaceae bacterium]
WIAPSNDTLHAKQISYGTGRADFSVSWTPDNKIAFDSTASGGRNIWIMNADGGNQRQLTTEGGANQSVSPDGKTIAFASSRTGIAHVFLMDADGGNVKQLTNGSGEFVPTFSPDGKWVLYNSRQSGRITLWRVSADGGEPQQLTTSHSYNISVSPNGKWLTANYREDTPNAPDKLAIFPFEGGQPVKIFDNIPTAGQHIYWTPESRSLIYINTRNGISNLWMQPVDGGAPKQLTDFKSDIIYSFDYSRDGKKLALSRGTQTIDVVLISNFR